MINKNQRTNKRKLRVKSKLQKADRPRLIVTRSNKHIYAQIVDQTTGKTLVGVNDFKDSSSAKKMTKTQLAENVGTEIAKLAKKAKIKEVVFDRQGYKYHGRIKALAEKAREIGLKF